MLTAKKIADWVFNFILVAAAIGLGAGAVYADTVSKKWALGTTGLAFAIAAFIFIRFTIQTQLDEAKK